jgi:quinoprotein glucose dehydrogenase
VVYRGKDGREYVAVVAVGAGLGGPGPRGPDGRPLNGEALVAYALPR